MMRLYKISYEGGSRLVREVGKECSLLPEDWTITGLLGLRDPWTEVSRVAASPTQVRELLSPIDDQELWAAGVTYAKSQKARERESDHSNCYEKVRSAIRPQIFPKGRGRNAITTETALFLRPDSTWTVPEPEVVLVMNRFGKIVGHTLGNDLSCRDIEGENPLYQPQAKMWHHSTVIGPCLNFWKETPSSFQLKMKITRGTEAVFQGEASTQNMSRTFEELRDYLFRYREFPDGVFLFTGTGIVPPDSFALKSGDRVEISETATGTLSNPAEMLSESEER